MIFQKTIKRSAMLCGLLAALCASSAAQATPSVPPGWSGLSLDVTLNSGLNTVTNIAIFTNNSTGGSGYGRFFTVHSGFNEITAALPPGSGLPLSGFAAGVIAGLPGDPSGSAINHLVVFGAFSDAELTMDYDTLFPHIAESTFISDLLTIPNTSPIPFADVSALRGDAQADHLYGVNGTAIKAVAFSTGTLIGTGSVLITLPATVPEPMTLALFGAGLAGMAAVRRRKNKMA